jgi:hypothetical protein
MSQNEAINTLRRRIRQAGRQFRQNNDNSESLFHPQQGFIYGYDIAEVEDALNDFEHEIPTELWEDSRTPIVMG